MTLPEFLLACVAEDEAVARKVKPLRVIYPMGGKGEPERFTHQRLTYASEDGYPRLEHDVEAAAHFARHDPAFVLAECAAKRAIVEEHGCDYDECPHCPRVLRVLAAVYADRPGYDPAWGVQ